MVITVSLLDDLRAAHPLKQLHESERMAKRKAALKVMRGNLASQNTQKVMRGNLASQNTQLDEVKAVFVRMDIYSRFNIVPTDEFVSDMLALPFYDRDYVFEKFEQANSTKPVWPEIKWPYMEVDDKRVIGMDLGRE